MTDRERILKLQAGPEEPTGALSPLHEPVWRGVRRIGVGILAASLVEGILGQSHPMGLAGIVALCGWAWYEAIRLLLLKSRLPRFWRGWLVVVVLALLLAGDAPAGAAIALGATLLFLLLRTYAPLWELAGAGRAYTAVIGAVTLLLLPWYILPESTGWLAGIAHGIAHYLTWSLRLFWLIVLLHLGFRMRLHFLRLKPKLAVTGFLLAVVPILLLAALALFLLWGAVGGERSRHAAEMIRTAIEPRDDQEWGVPFTGAEGFEVEMEAGEVPALGPRWLGVVVGILHRPAPPDTLPRDPYWERLRSRAGGWTRFLSLQDSLAWRESIGGAVWSPADTAALFQVGGELWALRLEGLAGNRLRIRGRRLDDRGVQRLAGSVKSDLRIEGLGYLLTGQNVPPQRPGAGLSPPGDPTYPGGRRAPQEHSGLFPDSLRVPVELRGRYERRSASPDTAYAFPHQPLFFGLARLPVLRLRQDRFEVSSMVLVARRSPAAFAQDLFAGSDRINRVFVSIGGLLAILFMLVTAAALFLGARITGGITAAVSTLQQGTRRIARGDLDTRIHIRNRDEFGDLAQTFNRMAAAVKQGREEAVAREGLEHDLATARRIQLSLLPRNMPEMTGFQVAATSLPSLVVGGDYFDFVDLHDGHLGLAIGDVSGKGVPAALLMANLQATLQGQVIHPGSVAQTVNRINHLLLRHADTEMYATFFYGVLDRESGAFIYANAGHEPPLLLRADGSLHYLDSGGIPIGMIPGWQGEEDSVDIGPGDLLVCYTDGITEAMTPETLRTLELPILTWADAGGAAEGSEPATGRALERSVIEAQRLGEPQREDADPDFFGIDRLIEVLRKVSDREASAVRDAILQAVADFTGGGPASDDMTVVVIKRTS